MLAHELSFQMMDSKILGFLDLSDFSAWANYSTSLTTCCCIIVTSGWETASEIELGLCSPDLTAATPWSGTVEVSVKVSK